MSSNNGTKEETKAEPTEAEVKAWEEKNERIAQEMLDKAEKEAKAKSKKPAKAKSKTKASRFWTLWAATRDNSSGKKAKVKGHVKTDLGEVSVTLDAFPATLSDEAYEDAAQEKGIAVKYDLEGMKAAGIDLDSATDKLKADAALMFLAAVQETGGMEVEDDE